MPALLWCRFFFFFSFFFFHVTFAYGASFKVFTIPVLILVIYYPWLTPNLAFDVTFAYGASFEVFTIPVVISFEGNVLTDFRCFPGLLQNYRNNKLEFSMNIPLWLIWLKLYMVLDYRIRIDGWPEFFTIHIGQNDRSSREGFLHHVRTLIWWCKLPLWIWKGHVPLLQNEISRLESAGSSLLVVSSFDPSLV